MKKRSLRCIIGIAVLMLLSVFLLSGCTKNKKEEQKDTDVKENLQADESVDEEEGPSVNFEDIFSNENENEEDAVEEDNKQGNNKQENNKQNNKQENNKQENNKQEDNKQEDKEDLEGVGDNTEQGWSPFY